MKRSIGKVGLCLALLAGLHAVPSASAATNLSNFKFDGVPIGASLSDCQRKYPTMTVDRQETDDAIGVKCYLAINVRTADGILLKFHKGRLYRIMIVYKVERLQTMGGAEQVCARIIETFGQPASVERPASGLLIRWNESARIAELAVISSGVALTVTDTVTEAIVNQAKARGADLGF